MTERPTVQIPTGGVNHLGGKPRTPENPAVLPLSTAARGKIRANYERILEYAKGKECYDCFSYVWPGFVDGEFKLRCKEGFNPDPVKRELVTVRREGMLARSIPGIKNLFNKEQEE